MSPFARILSVLALVPVLTSALPAQTAGQTPAPPAPAAATSGTTQEPFDRKAYEAHLQQAFGATAEQLQQFAQQVGELGAARAGDALLRALLPDYDRAVKQSEDGDPTAAVALAKLLAGTQDPVLAGHLRYHLARVFLDGDDPDRADEILAEFERDNRNRTPLDGEALYFHAQALAEIPKPDAALPRFRSFLQSYPDASERFRAAAAQRIGELERQQDSRLHTLADGMKKVTRDLRKQKTDEPVQVEQQGFIEELNELIEMYEEMEKQGSGSPSGNQQSSGPASNSALVEGEARIGSLDKRPSLADRWGELRDKDREKVEATVQNDLPPQYRKMLEEYYKKLGTGGAK